MAISPHSIPWRPCPPNVALGQVAEHLTHRPLCVAPEPLRPLGAPHRHAGEDLANRFGADATKHLVDRLRHQLVKEEAVEESCQVEAAAILCGHRPKEQRLDDHNVGDLRHALAESPLLALRPPQAAALCGRPAYRATAVDAQPCRVRNLVQRAGNKVAARPCRPGRLHVRRAGRQRAARDSPLSRALFEVPLGVALVAGEQVLDADAHVAKGDLTAREPQRQAAQRLAQLRDAAQPQRRLARVLLELLQRGAPLGRRRRRQAAGVHPVQAHVNLAGEAFAELRRAERAHRRAAQLGVGEIESARD
mmetsp:Transcript_36629/g.108892  ORF Transcript_36629/g.108892 Transcript_36629/m.108892 type:complete len:306 (+) Transcript_36629:260-1177(+)